MGWYGLPIACSVLIQPQTVLLNSTLQQSFPKCFALRSAVSKAMMTRAFCCPSMLIRLVIVPPNHPTIQPSIHPSVSRQWQPQLDTGGTATCQLGVTATPKHIGARYRDYSSQLDGMADTWDPWKGSARGWEGGGGVAADSQGDGHQTPQPVMINETEITVEDYWEGKKKLKNWKMAMRNKQTLCITCHH